MKAQNILQTIGNTPHLKINKIFGSKANVWLKIEKQNPGGSIKDRIALAMIEDAEQKGILKKGSIIVEPTSGNTGIGLAMVAAVKGYQIILVMPETMSVERRKVMKAYGAEFVLTDKEEGMNGAIKKANEIVTENKNAWIPQQFENPANIEAHIKTTAEEIFADFPEGIDYLISGVGTGGHLTGTAMVLKQRIPNLKVFAVEPENSSVISGGKPGPHTIQGIGAGFIPKNLNKNLLDGTIKVTSGEAFDFTRRVAKEEGLFTGISTGATLAAINKKIKEIPEGKTVLGFNYDGGEKYLSVADLF